MPDPNTSLLDLVAGRSIAVVIGAGGVGKTTVAAAVAAISAARGMRVLAVTVDPSNRLKDSLGLSGRPGVEEPVDVRHFGGSASGGALFAMVLDAATEMERLVERAVADQEARRRITGNVFYRKALAHMAGTHEYTAMQRLLEALESGRYDLVVLDTPPDRHALEFLDAPERLDALLSSDVFRLFVTASRGASTLGLSVLKWRSVILKGISRFAGEETFLAVLDFILAFSPLYDWFQERARQARRWFKGGKSATFLVCRPGHRVTEDVRAGIDALNARGIVPSAIVANRVHRWPLDGSSGGAVDAASMKDAMFNDPALSLYDRKTLSDLASSTLALATEYRALATEDGTRLDLASKAAGPIPMFRIPLLREEVRDLRTLSLFADVMARVREG